MLEIVKNSEENKLWIEHTPIELKMNYKMKHNIHNELNRNIFLKIG